MSEGKVKEIKEFIEDFNKKLRKSFQLYELKNAKAKKLKKNFSQVNDRIKMKNLLLKKNEENKCCPKKDNLIINIAKNNVMQKKL